MGQDIDRFKGMVWWSLHASRIAQPLSLGLAEGRYRDMTILGGAAAILATVVGIVAVSSFIERGGRNRRIIIAAVGVILCAAFILFEYVIPSKG